MIRGRLITEPTVLESRPSDIQPPAEVFDHHVKLSRRTLFSSKDDIPKSGSSPHENSYDPPASFQISSKGETPKSSPSPHENTNLPMGQSPSDISSVVFHKDETPKSGPSPHENNTLPMGQTPSDISSVVFHKSETPKSGPSPFEHSYNPQSSRDLNISTDQHPQRIEPSNNNRNSFGSEISDSLRSGSTPRHNKDRPKKHPRINYGLF